MDSLLANYASSDDDEGERIKVPKPSSSLSKPPSSSISIIEPPASKSKPSLFSTLPPPKTLTTSSSVSLPPPPKLNRNHETDQNQLIESKQSKPLFSSLPQPKPKPPNPQSSSSGPNPKRVVQFTPPLNPSLLKPNDLDDEDDDSEQARKPIKDSSSNSTSSKALSSMLPAPKNSLCLAPTTASRRSAFDSSVSSSNPEESTNFDNNGSSKVAGSYPLEQGVSEYGNYESSNVESSYPLQQHGAGGYVENHGGYDVSWATNGSVDSSYGAGYESSVGEYGSCAGNWSNANVVTEAPVVPEIERIVGKRGRREIPTNIVEVNQAELIKNRPREDQVKSTGIAFGPAYQPVSTSKGKPSKLHKRKHQIGSLYFDMRQKESELAERRSKGFLTKAETQAKYGW